MTFFKELLKHSFPGFRLNMLLPESLPQKGQPVSSVRSFQDLVQGEVKEDENER